MKTYQEEDSRALFDSGGVIPRNRSRVRVVEGPTLHGGFVDDDERIARVFRDTKKSEHLRSKMFREVRLDFSWEIGVLEDDGGLLLRVSAAGWSYDYVRNFCDRL